MLAFMPAFGYPANARTQADREQMPMKPTWLLVVGLTAAPLASSGFAQQYLHPQFVHFINDDIWFMRIQNFW